VWFGNARRVEMLIITGLGRCGTTVMIQFIKNLGFDIGSPNDYNYNEKIRGGVEHIFVRELNKRLRSFASRAGILDIEKEMPTIGSKKMWKVKDQINGVRLDAYKELVIFTNPVIIRAWWESRKDITLLICHRKFQEIFASVEEKNKIMGPGERQVGDVFKTQFADFITEVLLLGIPYRILMFPQFLLDYDSVYDSLRYLGLDFDKQTGEGIWKDTVNLDYVTQTPGFDESV